MVQYTKVFQGVATEEQCYALFNRYSGQPFEARTEDLYEGDYWEVSAQQYNYFLEILPPYTYSSGYFAMCEATTGDIRTTFVRVQDEGKERYFAASIKVGKHSDIFDLRDAIMADIANGIVGHPKPQMNVIPPATTSAEPDF